MRRVRCMLLLMLACSACSIAEPITIEVAGLFHPRQIEVRGPQGALVLVRGGRHSLTIGENDCNVATVKLGAHSASVTCGGVRFRAASIEFTPVAASNELQLAIPGRFQRTYRGSFDVFAGRQQLHIVLNTELEVAVASVVAAELPREAPIEALKAQAVAVRSFFVSAPARHIHSKFCDTTHCQLLRSPAQPASAAARAAKATEGQVLTFNGDVIPAYYSASCSGRTHSLAEIGYDTSSYPYYAVACPVCARNPDRWSSYLSADDLRLLASHSERERIRVSRVLGWKAVPSTNYTVDHSNKTEKIIVVDGVGRGHGLGLCQRGAIGLAREGRTYREILDHYYPNTTISTTR